jgi:hypothetical protein
VCPLLEDEPPFLPGNALEILRKHFVSFALKNEVHQHPTLTGHLEVESEVNKSNFLDICVMYDLTKGAADFVIDHLFAKVEYFFHQKSAMHSGSRRVQRADQLPR